MRREGRKSVAARRRPESSGLHKPFPHSGNGNKHDNPTRYPAKPDIALRLAYSKKSCKDLFKASLIIQVRHPLQVISPLIYRIFIIGKSVIIPKQN